MADRDMAMRALHEVSVAAWFGGSLMGAIGVNGAASAAASPQERLRLAGEGWRRWQPVQSAAVTSHVVAAAWVTWSNKGRIAAQESVAPLALAKGALTGAAIGATVLAATVGRRLSQRAGAPVEGATDLSEATPADVRRAQRAQRALQWAVPALTGTLVVIDAVMGEQQRPSRVAPGLLRRLF